MTRRYALLLTAAATAAVALLVVAVWPGPPAHTLPRRDPDRLYRMLLDSDFSDLGLQHGLEFTGVRGMLPPDEAEPERHWLLYAEFDGPAGRHRIAFYIPLGERLEEMEEHSRRSRRCVPYFDIGWECLGSIRGTYVRGDVVCLRPRCEAHKAQAETLLYLGMRHLQRVLAST